MDWILTGQLLVIVVLIVGNAFFVGSEIALTSARRSRIEQLANIGNRSAKIVQVLHDEPERFYSVSQIGITLVSLGLGAIGIITMTQVLDPGIAWVFGLFSGEEVMGWTHTLAYILGFVILSPACRRRRTRAESAGVSQGGSHQPRRRPDHQLAARHHAPADLGHEQGVQRRLVVIRTKRPGGPGRGAFLDDCRADSNHS